MPIEESRVFVGQVSVDATEEDIRQLFDYFGEVIHVNILRDRPSGRSNGSAFVTYGSTEEADAAITALHNTYFMGRDKPLQVTYGNGSPYISDFGRAHGQQVADENPSNPRPRPRPN